eukprot:scaffold275107_cov55-Attheya_sp.AAC.2
MSRHEVALSGLLLGLVVSVGNGFQSSYLPLTQDVRPATSRRGVSSAYYDGKHGGGRSSSSEEEEEESFSSATLTYLQTLGSSSIESISSSLTPDDVDEEQAAVELRSRVLQDRIRGDTRQPSSTSSSSYVVTLPLVSTKTNGQVAAVSASLGVTLVQMSSNGYSELALDLDSLQFSNSPLAAALDQNVVKEEDPAIQFLDKIMTGILEEDDKNLDGVIVSSVVRGGIAWNAGVRAGDTLVATSATMGDVSVYTDVYYLFEFHMMACSTAIGVNVVFVGGVVCSHACIIVETMAQKNIGGCTIRTFLTANCIVGNVARVPTVGGSNDSNFSITSSGNI